MTKAELNRDVKRLLKLYKTEPKDLKLTESEKNNKIEKELRRLYYADREFEYFNKQSILILMRINLKHAVIPTHNFGIHINLEKL